MSLSAKIALILAATSNGSSTATPTTADGVANPAAETVAEPEMSAPDPDDEETHYELEVECLEFAEHVDMRGIPAG